MTEQEQDGFEAELRQLKPVKLPEGLMARLRTIDLPGDSPVSKSPLPAPTAPNFWFLLRWLIPATAVVLVSAVFWRNNQASTRKPSPEISPQITATQVKTPVLKADNIEIGKKLVSSFDAVATLPGGEPVRFRCQQWMDQVVVNDKSQGLLVESRMPRVVVIPVGFETY